MQADSPPGEPTPEEIRERCLAIQATWSDQERESRFSAGRTGPGRPRSSRPAAWTVPIVKSHIR